MRNGAVLRLAKSLVVTALMVPALTGCTLFYPNWDTPRPTFSTPLPSATDSTADPSESPSASESPSQSASPSPSASPLKVAKLELIDLFVDETSGTLSLVAQVTNVAENGGTCRMIFSSGGTEKTVDVKAEANVNSTQCFPIEYPLSLLPKGKGRVAVAYFSAAYEGRTEAREVVIP